MTGQARNKIGLKPDLRAEQPLQSYLVDYQVRRASLDDLDGLYALAELSGPGFTSLPVDRDRLSARLEAASKPDTDDYLLMLDHKPTGQIAGCCAIKAVSGTNAAHWNFQLSDFDDEGPIIRADTTLSPTKAFAGYSELGTLFLHPKHRHPGVGRFLSLSRLMFIALKPDLFSETIWSELRGDVSASARSDFYDGIMGPALGLPFRQADRLYALEGNERITPYLPRKPLKLGALPETALAVLGKTHKAGVGARKLLETAGFTFSGVVDLFDGGPLMSIKRDDLPIRQKLRPLADKGPCTERSMIAAYDEETGFLCHAREAGLTFNAVGPAQNWQVTAF